jgi:O-antigen ligase
MKRNLFTLSIILLLATVLVTRDNLMVGVVSAKRFWFYGCMTLLTGCALFLPKTKYRFSLLDGLVSAFVVVVFVSSFAINRIPFNSTKPIAFALLPVLYFTLRLNSGNIRWNAVFAGIVIVGLIEALWGELQILGLLPSQNGLYRLSGSLLNPGPFAGFLAVVMPVTVVKAIKGYSSIKGFKDNNLQRLLSLLSLATIVAIALVLPAARSRAAWLAVIVGCGIAVCYCISEQLKQIAIRLKTNRWIWLIVALVVIVVAGALAGMYAAKKDSADGRVLIWKIGLQTAIHHPFGVGLGRFAGVYADEQAAYFESAHGSSQEENVAGSIEHAFNEYLQIGVESGILALALFIAIAAVAFLNLLRRDTGAAGSLAAILVFACFSYPFSVLPFLTALVVLLAYSQRLLSDYDNINIEKTKFIITQIFSLILFVFSLFVLYNRMPVYGAYQHWYFAHRLFEAEEYEKCAEAYRLIEPFLDDNVYFLFEYGQSLSRAGLKGNTECLAASNAALQKAMQITCDPMLYNITGKNFQAIKKYDDAERCFLKAAAIAPSRLYPWYLLAKLYEETGQMNKACSTATKVLTREPKVNSQAVEEMREEMRKISDACGDPAVVK